jgi:regulator of protease activity HflC (stomatin/prohibitin superfamily)
MFMIIISLVVTIGLFVVFGFDRNEETWKLNKKQFIAVAGLLIMLLGCFTKVPANHVGIVYSPFGGTKTETLSEGFKFKSPLDKVYKISTEVQTVSLENITTQTKDAQFLTTVMNIKYNVNNSNAFMVFKQFRTLDNVGANLIPDTAQRVLERVTTKYDIIYILGEGRNTIYTEVEAEMAAELAGYGIDFKSITINDMDAGDQLEAAIAAEAVAKKAVETAEQELLKAETEAKQKSVQALADQEAAKIKAETKKIEAQAEKEANEMLNKSLSDDILTKEWIEKWDGKMPTYYGGDDAGLMFNVGN